MAGSLLARLFPKDGSLRRVIESVAEISADWSQLDPRSDGYRYPIDTRGQASTKKQQTISLRAMASRMSAMLEDLHTIHFGLDVETCEARELYEAVEWSISSFISQSEQ